MQEENSILVKSKLLIFGKNNDELAPQLLN